MRVLCAAVIREGAGETSRVLYNTDRRPEGPVPGHLRARRQPPLPTRLGQLGRGSAPHGPGLVVVLYSWPWEPPAGMVRDTSKI